MQRIIGIFIILFASQYACSQLVNIENLRKNKKQGWQASVSANYQFTKNTRTINMIKGNWGLQYTNDRQTLLFFGGLSVLKIDTLNQLINGGFEHIRYNYSLKNCSWLTLEAFAQHQFNYIKYLQRRVINGYGPRAQIINNEKFKLYFAPLVMYENEIYNDDNNTITNQIKGDFIVTFNLDINKNVSINHVTYYQPKLDKWSDFRLSTQTSFNIVLVKNLTLGLSFDLSYDAIPPIKDNAPITNLFYSSQNFLSYTF